MMTGTAPLLRFRGARGEAKSSLALVVVEDALSREVLGPLEHRVRYSPTGLNWGYERAGPWDLARSLLAAALGERALCPSCGGTGCGPCRDGLRDDLPTVPFAREVVARLESEWSLHSDQVRAWFDQHQRFEREARRRGW